MKRIALLVLAMGMSVSAFANQASPINAKGVETDPKYGGTSTCIIDSSTGTAAVLCTTGSGIILDVVGSSVATTDTIVIRDSATANTTSAKLYVIDKNSLDKANRVFPRFKNGLSVNALIAPGGALGGTLLPSWVVVYTKDIN